MDPVQPGRNAEEMPILSLLEGKHCLVKHGQVFSGIPFSNVRSYCYFKSRGRWIPNNLHNKPGISGREVQHFTALRRPAWHPSRKVTAGAWRWHPGYSISRRMGQGLLSTLTDHSWQRTERWPQNKRAAAYLYTEPMCWSSAAPETRGSFQFRRESLFTDTV